MEAVIYWVLALIAPAVIVFVVIAALLMDRRRRVARLERSVERDSGLTIMGRTPW